MQGGLLTVSFGVALHTTVVTAAQLRQDVGAMQVGGCVRVCVCVFQVHQPELEFVCARACVGVW